MRIVVRARALRHLEAIARHIGERDPQAALRVMARLESAIRGLADHPRSGPLGVVPGTRQLTLPGLPYLIIYRVAADEVTILAVLHAARNIRS